VCCACRRDVFKGGGCHHDKGVGSS
jgi:hypothetical protein